MMLSHITTGAIDVDTYHYLYLHTYIVIYIVIRHWFRHILKSTGPRRIRLGAIYI